MSDYSFTTALYKKGIWATLQLSFIGIMLAFSGCGGGSNSTTATTTNPSSTNPPSSVTVPGAPTGVIALRGNTTAAISFTPPANNGGVAITSYAVTSAPGNITASGTSSPISVTGLTNGTAYTFKVTATNIVGTGTASNASNSITPSANSPASGATTAVGSYIADHITPGFVGSWAITPAWVVPASAVVAAESNLVATGPTTYNNTNVEKLLSGVTWGPNPNPWLVGACYDLIPTGWLQCPSTGAWVDSGDGSTIVITNTGEPAIAVTMASTNLAGNPITCTSPTTGLVVACSVPGNYPVGAVAYTQTFGSDWYSLCGGNSGCTAITDSSGAALIALPNVGATGPTFCDTDNFSVLQPINPAPAAGMNNYNVFSTASCLAADIASAIASPAAGSVLVSIQNTGNSVVPTVLRLSATGTLAGMNNYIYGMRAGNVWYGWMTPNGTVGSTEENKIAINAELVANGLTLLP